MTKRYSYSFWTQSEKNELLERVSENRAGGRIDWETICLYFPERTKQQCKSVFNNTRLKKRMLKLRSAKVNAIKQQDEKPKTTGMFVMND